MKEEITVEELNKWRLTGHTHLLIDVREVYENEMANIGGRLIPMGEITKHLDEIPKDIPVVFHCKSGGRSANVTKYFLQRGWDNVLNLQGGIFAWIERIDPSMSKY